jgi:hypothetical protein
VSRAVVGCTYPYVLVKRNLGLERGEWTGSFATRCPDLDSF